MALYDYINYNYPDDVKKGYNTKSYKSFLETAQATIDKRNNDSKTYEKYLNTQKKLKEKRDKAAQKMMKTNDPWAAGYSTLMLMVGSEN